MSTRVTGVPLVTGTPPLLLSLDYTAPYQGGTLGLSTKTYRATWDYTSARWLDPSGAELLIPLPRQGQNDPGLKGKLLARITANYSATRIETALINLAGYETSAGILDLTVDPAPVVFVTAATLAQLVTDATAAKTAANAAASSANAAAGSLNAAVSSIATVTAAQAANVRYTLAQLTADLRLNLTGSTLPPAVARPPIAERFAAPFYTTGPLGGQRGWVTSTGTAAVQSDGSVLIDSNVASPAVTGTISPYTFSEGTFRVLVSNSTPNIAIQWGGPAGLGTHYAVWCSSGANIETGYWVAGSTGISGVVSKATFARPAVDYFVEVSMGPPYSGSGWAVYVWDATLPKPTTASLSVSLTAGDPLLGEGPITLASLGATAKYQLFMQDDWQRPQNPVSAVATPVGPWYSRYEGTTNTLCTDTSGSELRCTVSNTTGVALNLSIPPGMAFRPVIAARYRQTGATAYSAWTRTAVGTTGAVIRVDPVTGLNTALSYDVQLAFNVHETDPHWLQGAGACVQSVFVAAGGTIRPLVEPQRLRILGVGDSIMAGIVAGGHDVAPNPASTPGVLISEQNWLHVMCDTLGAIPLQNGYGGTGVTVPGNGGIPKAQDNVSGFMVNRVKSFSPGDPHVIIVDHGTNDDGAANRTPPAKPTSPVFRAAYRDLCLFLLGRYPQALLICKRPFNGGFAAEIQDVANELGLGYMDTTGWLSQAAGDYSGIDPVHPLAFPPGTDKGHRKAGRLAAADLISRGIPIVP